MDVDYASVGPPAVEDGGRAHGYGPASKAVDAMADLVDRYRSLGLLVEAYKAEMDSIKAVITDQLGECETGTVHGLPVVTYKHVERTTFDTTAFRQAEPQIFAAYSRTAVHRRFVVTKQVV